MSRLFAWLLNVGYLLVLLVALPLLAWSALRHGKYREGYAQKLLGRVPWRTGQEPCIWIHAVSVGEVNLVAPLVDALHRRHPEWEIVVSATTKTGFDLARQKHGRFVVFYCPLDFSWAVRQAMQRIRPTQLVLAELELWPNLIQAAKEQGAHVAIINGRLSDPSFRGYRRIRPLVNRVLRQVDLIAAQNQEVAARFRQLSAPADRVHVTGSLKYDGAVTDRDNSRTRQLRELAGLTAAETVFLAGSTQAPEEELALKTFLRLRPRYPNLRFILVPRHPERFEEVAQLLDNAPVTWQRRSELTSQLTTECQPTSHANQPPPVLLVDTVGELGAWWGTAQIAFVGGSFGSRGGQNMIEPAAYGAAVAFGPNTRNFRDIVAALLARDAAMMVSEPEQLTQFVQRCLDNPAGVAALGRRARGLVVSQQGATQRTVALLEAGVPQTDRARGRTANAA